MIEIDGVSVSFGDSPVLTGVDLQVDRGELVGFVGPNGAGKTTLLRTVNGLLDPDAGEVRVGGDSVSALDARTVGRRVATVPQDTHLSFAFTVEQVVEMGRTPHRSRLDWSGAGDAVADALERTETDYLAERTVDDLSGGERQRVLLARALAQAAPVLVLDEPTASLDVTHQVRVLELVRSLVDDGRAALAAIHDLDLAARYCDRLAVLSGGELLATGAPRSVLTAERVEAAFDAAAVVSEDTLTGTPRVTAVGERPDRDCHVHVVGTGREAARALGACWRAGFEVSVGPIPEGDVAAALADDLGVAAVTAPPVQVRDEATTDALRDVLAGADAVLQVAGDPPGVSVAEAAAVPVVQWSGATAECHVRTDGIDGDRRVADASTGDDGSTGPPDALADAVLAAIPDAVTGDD